MALVLPGTACALRESGPSWQCRQSSILALQGLRVRAHASPGMGKKVVGRAEMENKGRVTPTSPFPARGVGKMGMAHAAGSFPPVAATPTWQPPACSAWFANSFDNVLLLKLLKKLSCLEKSSQGTFG